MKKGLISLVILVIILFFGYSYWVTYSRENRFIGHWETNNDVFAALNFLTNLQPNFTIRKDGNNYTLFGNNLFRVGVKDTYVFKLKGGILVSNDSVENIQYVKSKDGGCYLVWQKTAWYKSK